MRSTISRSRSAAFLCAFAVLLCALIGRPFVEMGVSDDWSYIRTAHILAQTGHVVYNAWSAPILGYQLFFAALFINFFGFSFSVVRATTILTSMLLAWFLQRCLVRSGLSERNATLGTLALVLNPIYLLLSVTFLTDIPGLFAVVICLYACIRALQAATPRAATLWICFAAIANAVLGTTRQVAWLGLLVLVPSTLWLFRKRRSVLVPGIVVTCLSVLFIFGCIHWYNQQLYSVPEHLLHDASAKGLASIPNQFIRAFLNIPFLLLPLMLAFIPELRRSSRRLAIVFISATVGYLLLAALLFRHHGPTSMVEPLLGDWFGLHGYYDSIFLTGDSKVAGERLVEGSHLLVLRTGVRILLTIVSLASLFALIASLSAPRRTVRRRPSPRFHGRRCAPFFSPSVALLLRF